MVRKCFISDDWTVESGSYFLGNKFHPCAVLVPLDDDIGKEIIKHAVDVGVAIAGFCKTANIGIEKVICNILANPNIRYIIVAGNENPGHKSGKAIINLWKYGIDPRTRRIMCGSDKPCMDIPTGYVPNLPLDAIERFRKQIIYVIDLLIDGKEVTKENVLEYVLNAIRGTIQEPENRIILKVKNQEYTLYDPGAFDEKPYIITITSKADKTYIETLSPYLTVIVTKSIAKAYEEILPLIENYGYIVDTHYGTTKELMNVVVHILDPNDNKIPEKYPLASKDYIQKYCEALIKGEHIEGFEYSYGERLRIKFGDQLEELISKLIQDLSTRQGLVALWDPYHDLKSKVPPCLTHIQILIRDRKIHLIAYLRSHDFKNAFIHNAFGLREIMMYIRDRLREVGIDLELGTLTMIVSSCHIYLS